VAARDIVHARLDEETRLILARLRRRTGLRDSELIRRALRALDAGPKARPRPRIVGLGEFDSGLGDLASNKRHLHGFGRS
jgi:hypothetical protein